MGAVGRGRSAEATWPFQAAEVGLERLFVNAPGVAFDPLIRLMVVYSSVEVDHLPCSAKKNSHLSSGTDVLINPTFDNIRRTRSSLVHRCTGTAVKRTMEGNVLDAQECQ